MTSWRAIIILFGAVLLNACATPPPVVDSRPTYTRASIAPLSTAGLAALFLSPEDAATVERHEAGEPDWPDGPLWGIFFYGRPRSLTNDICGRDIFLALFDLVGPRNLEARRRDTPVRFRTTSRATRVAWDPNCSSHPDRLFASVGYRYANVGERLTLDGGIAILRRLAQARTEAAGDGPLPFRLHCTTERALGRPTVECPPDPRPLLAAMPIHRAITVDRAPFRKNTLCGPPDPETGDSVEIEMSEREMNVWEIRLVDMDTESAEIRMSWQVARHVPRC